MRFLTFSDAVSVRVKTVLESWTLNIGPLRGFTSRPVTAGFLGGLTILPDPDLHVAGLGVVQRGELLDASPADRFHDTFAEAPVEVADQFGVGLRQLAERAVQEFDAGVTAGGAVALDLGLVLQRRLET